jgi:two-component system nitrate/nitrite response regulator NarL
MQIAACIPHATHSKRDIGRDAPVLGRFVIVELFCRKFFLHQRVLFPILQPSSVAPSPLRKLSRLRLMAVVQDSISPNRATTVVVADGNRMDCQLLVQAIERDKRFEVIGCATRSTEAIAAVRKNQPDVVMLSTRLQDGALAGLMVLQTLRGLQLASRVVILLDNEERELVVKAFRAGARGIFCRTGGSSELRECIHSVHNGKIWASKTQWEWIVAALNKAPIARTTQTQNQKVLSKREMEVARLVAAAMSNRELSQKLGLSEHTVKNYMSRIFEKLGISTRTELALYVLSHAKPASGHSQPSQSVHKKRA